MTQLLPSDDLFAAGSPAYGGSGTGFLPLYLGAKFAHTTALSGVWLPNAVAMVQRPLHSGYQTVNPVTGQVDYNGAFYNSGTGTVAHASSRAASGMQFRTAFAADCVTSGIFEMRPIAGIPALAELAPRGVFARAQAGTLSGDGGADPEIRDGSCYLAAIYQKQSDSTFRLGIIKFVAGAATVLSETVALPSTVDFSKLVTITLTCAGTSISASAVGFGGTVPITLGPVTDASVAGSGRCGFIMGADREPVAGKRSVDLCHMLQVAEAGVVKLRDEFRRLSLAAGKRTTADITSTVGNYLTSAFYWDAGTFDESYASGGKTYTGARKLLRHATAGRVVLNHTVTDDDVNAGRLLLSQRPADSQFSQHRTVKIVIPTAADSLTGEVWAGIVLRGRQAQPLDESTPTIGVFGAGPNFCGNGIAGTGGTGYLFVCRAITGSAVVWELRRIVNNAHQTIATLIDISAFSVFPGYGTQFTMGFEVYPRNEGDPYGPVELVCMVNSALVNLTLSGTVPSSITRLSTGVFLDASTARVQSNFGEGLVTANGLNRGGSASADIDPNFEAWTQGVLTNVVELDEDQASAVMLTEGAAAGAALDTLTIPTELPIVHQGWTISNPFDSGHRQTAPRFKNQATDTLFRRRRYRFFKAAAREAELAAVIAHFHSHNGKEIPFSYTPPGGTADKVHYISDRIRHRMVRPDAHEMEFELESLV